MSTFKQALELTFRRNKFGRTTVHQVLSVKLSGTGLPDFRKLILTVLRVLLYIPTCDINYENEHRF